MTRFNSFVAIDWSGAKGPRQKGIAVALCNRDDAVPELVFPDWLASGLQVWSREDVLRWLLHALPDNTLVGLDLSPGLPFEDHGAYFPGWELSPPDAKSLWRLVDEIAQDDLHLAATSFICHAEARRHFRHAKGDCGDLFESGTGRLRRTEKQQKAHRLAPSSCFNLIGAAQVGKSSLTGMRVLNRLGGAMPVWPYDVLPDTGSVIVEIYTSLAAREANLPPGRAKMTDQAALQKALDTFSLPEHLPLDRYTDHATDAILTAAWLRRAADRAELWQPEALTPQVARTEGWTFGVV